VAAFIPANKCLRVQCLFLDADGHVAQCRFYSTYSGSAPIPADLVAIAGDVETFMESELVPLMHSTWQTDGAIVTDLTSDTSPEGEVGGSTPGTLTGGRIPASTAMVVSQTTGRRYRGGHSRVYLPLGDTTKLLSDNTWEGAFVSAAESAWSSVVSAVSDSAWGGAGTITSVMASFYSGFTNVPYGTPVKYRRTPTGRATAVFFPVLTYVAKATVGTQRRRLRA